MLQNSTTYFYLTNNLFLFNETTILISEQVVLIQRINCFQVQRKTFLIQQNKLVVVLIK